MKRKTKILVYSISSLVLAFVLFTSIVISIRLQQAAIVTVRVVDENNEPIEGAYAQIPFSIKETSIWGVTKLWLNQNPQWIKVFIPKSGDKTGYKAIHHDMKPFEYRVIIDTSSPSNLLLSTEELYKEIELAKSYSVYRNSYFGMSEISLIDKSILHNPELLYRNREKAIK